MGTLPKVLIVTDQPFWRGETGAHQRILSLTKYFESQRFELTFYFMVERSVQDRLSCEQFHAKFVEFDPRGGAISQTIHSIFNWRKSKSDEAKNSLDSRKLESTTLERYRWPRAVDQFRSLVEHERPDVILIEYIVWAYLLEGLTTIDRRIMTIIDTHDVLHIRNEQFKNHGQTHWLDITADEESNELKRFDLILAIQPTEANTFEKLAPSVRSMVVGHVPWFERPTTDLLMASSYMQRDARSQTNADDCVRIGFIGSKNAANVDGIEWFIRNCWNRIVTSVNNHVELIVGGPVQELLVERLGGLIDSEPRIKFVGIVKSITQFYESIEIVINPVRFGTGLKIKSVEAFCFGKPLVATRHSVTGLPQAACVVARVADSDIEFASAVVTLVDDQQQRIQLATDSKRIGETVFSPESVYSELGAWVREQAAISAP